MSEPRCECCDLPLYSCGKAVEVQQRQAEQQERAVLLSSPGWVAARWPGQCGVCAEWFKAGTPIQADDCGWRAQCCADR